MKYGETLQQRSIPLWESCNKVPYFRASKLNVLTGHATPDNIDYNDIKHLIKVRTTHGQGQPKAIPGSDNETKAFHAFEDELYHELRDQHQRIDLFVQSKAGEVGRRLGKYLESLRRSIVLIPILRSPFRQANCTLGASELPCRPPNNTHQAFGEIFQAGGGCFKVGLRCEILRTEGPRSFNLAEPEKKYSPSHVLLEHNVWLSRSC